MLKNITTCIWVLPVHSAQRPRDGDMAIIKDVIAGDVMRVMWINVNIPYRQEERVLKLAGAARLASFQTHDYCSVYILKGIVDTILRPGLRVKWLYQILIYPPSRHICSHIFCDIVDDLKSAPNYIQDKVNHPPPNCDTPTSWFVQPSECVALRTMSRKKNNNKH